MKTSPIAVQTITARLNEAIGIDPRTLDAGRLRWIIGVRCRHLQLPDFATYAEFLEQTPAELDALIDEVVVQETRFFRDLVVYDHIRVAAAHIASTTAGPLRILSAPCGTGQEAYSLAATLLLLGLPPGRFTIDAFDVSLSALETARCGLYPERAFSHVSAELEQACGERQGKHWRVHQTLRERVHFTRRNLARPGALGDAAQYHLILCRNLFIYLAPEARAALAQSLSTALLPGGRLFLGTADRVEELNALFAPVRPAASFAFTHRRPRVAPAILPAAAGSVRSAVSDVANGSVVEATAYARSEPVDLEVDSLTTARELLQRALEHRQLGDAVKAERRCRQALYLAPNFVPAMELLQSLWSENPNLRLRRALRDRIRRNWPTRVPAAALDGLAPVEAAGWKETV